jgi:hypothetical protein
MFDTAKAKIKLMSIFLAKGAMVGSGADPGPGLGGATAQISYKQAFRSPWKSLAFNPR